LLVEGHTEGALELEQRLLRAGAGGTARRDGKCQRARRRALDAKVIADVACGASRTLAVARQHDVDDLNRVHVDDLHHTHVNDLEGVHVDDLVLRRRRHKRR